MKEKQKDNRRQGDNLSKERPGGGFEKKNTNPDGAPKKQQTPNEEVPNVGDHKKSGPIVASDHQSSKENENPKRRDEGLRQPANKDKAKQPREKVR